MFKNINNFYCGLVGVLVFSLTAPVMAAESWTAAGVRQVASSSASAVQVMPVNESGFATKVLCDQFISDQNGLALANNVKGALMFNHVDAKCSQARPGIN